MDEDDSDDDPLELPNIYASYRALLALVESRFLNLADRSYNQHAYVFSPILRDYYNIMNIPIIFKRYLEAIDILQYKDIIYFPAMSRNIFTQDGQFIPRPENIVLSNLRETVVALNASNVPDDDAGAMQHRQNFYKNNPIPGAIWTTNNYKLINADEIIPPDYDLHSHVYDDMHKLLSLSMKLSHDTKYINKDCTNRKDTRQRFSSFICNEMGDLRVCDRKPQQDLNYYYKMTNTRGRIESFYSRFRLKKDHVIKEGALFLLGEYPKDESFAKPIYELRSENVNSYYYDQCRNIHPLHYYSYHRDILASLHNA